MRTYLLLSLTATLLAVGCKKDDPEASLPPATQEGKNTAGCLVNGKAFVAKSYGGGLLNSSIPAIDGGFYYDSLYCVFINGQFDGRGIGITLFLRQPRTGTYLLNKNTQYYPQGNLRYILNHATYSVTDNSHEVYVTNSRHTGQVVLTKTNVQQGLSAGTFSFTAVSNQDSTKTVTITSGRFDRGDW